MVLLSLHVKIERHVLTSLARNIFNQSNWRIVLGFACLLAFLYSLFYTGQNHGYSICGFLFERIDLGVALFFMVIAFSVLGRSSKRARDSYFTPSIIWCHAILMVLGAAVALPETYGLAAILLEGFLVGVPFAVLTCAWGVELGLINSSKILIGVISSTCIAALMCLFVSCVASFISEAWGILSLLPLLSAWCLVSLSSRKNDTSVKGLAYQPAGLRISDFVASDEERSAAKLLSNKMYLGALFFGVSAGIMETYGSNPGMNAVQAFPATLIFLVLICFSLLQFPLSNNSEDARPFTQLLGDAYKLCFLVLMSGFLLTYVLYSFDIPGESIVLSAYLALVAVLTVLFVLLSQMNNVDSSIWFGRGFALLYAGELIGLLLGNLVEASGLAGEPPFACSTLAGIAALYAYLYLFTEQDFLSVLTITDERDKFQQTCELLAKRFSLSDRESEILPYVLRGRTSGRIGEELFISKSTVDTHLKRIYSKCGVHGRQELIDLSERRNEYQPPERRQ